jgi:alpha-L-fucosidase
MSPGRFSTHAIRVVLLGILSTTTSAHAAEPHVQQAQSAEVMGGASKIAPGANGDGELVSLAAPEQGVTFRGLPAGSVVAIRYGSVSVGTMSVAVGDQPARKVNVHSSGDLASSILVAKIELAIPAGATLTISSTDTDVPVCIEGIIVGDGDLGLPPDIWNLPSLPVADGPYPADWKELSRLYVTPAWWRDAKFGAWSHWDPQSMPEQGDWYSRHMYQEGNRVSAFHRRTYGHPSEYGYKDIAHHWKIDRWDASALMDLYAEMGARYFMAMGVHHDNFDCWDSTYQPWNSVRVGPRVDIVGAWEKVARAHGLRFGIGFHHTPARTWGQFMPVRYRSDRSGPRAGVPYDALQTILDGQGTWWEGMDPVDLYGPKHDATDPLHSPFANQFMWRVDDAIAKYRPDVIYFDEHAGDSQVDLGVQMGLGFLAPPLVANYYNKSLHWNSGNMDVVVNMKGVGGRYDSFQNSPELLPFVDRALVKSTEVIIESQIQPYSFQTETTIADWHYQTGQRHMDAHRIVRSLMQNVSRNGTMLLNLTQHGRGDLDPEVVRIAKDVGAWLKVNGEAVYASRPFEVSGDDDVCYTRNNGQLYATVLDWNGGPLTLAALRAGGATLGTVSKVEVLGAGAPLEFVQNDQGLSVTPPRQLQPVEGIANQQLASACRVLRISHDKGWINDDDPGAVAPGWSRRCNLGTGDFNNDLYVSNTPGDLWSYIQIDGQTRGMVDLAAHERQAQQSVWEVSGLAPGEHSIAVIHRGPGSVAVDALIVR